MREFLCHSHCHRPAHDALCLDVNIWYAEGDFHQFLTSLRRKVFSLLALRGILREVETLPIAIISECQQATNLWSIYVAYAKLAPFHKLTQISLEEDV